VSFSAQVVISDIVELLVSNGLIVRNVGDELAHSDSKITDLTDLRNARPGSMCWISKRQFGSNPSQTESFTGSLLLAPVGAVGKRVLECTDPKLAFALAASFCDPEASANEWAAGVSSPTSAPVVGQNARLAAGVFLGRGVVIGEDVTIGPNTCLQHVTIGNHSSIGANCSIGGQGFGLVWGADRGWVRFPHFGRVEIEERVEIGNNTCIDRGALGNTYVRTGARIDNLVHIAHNVDIGRHAMVIAHAMVAGSVTIGERGWIAPSAAIINQITIGAEAVVGLGAVVVKSVEAGVTVVGNPAKPLSPRGPSSDGKG
jgi:UDP-3-O-[3-hydroxymyristoyl] glucosamine N-acyltransferase LpxD